MKFRQRIDVIVLVKQGQFTLSDLYHKVTTINKAECVFPMLFHPNFAWDDNYREDAAQFKIGLEYFSNLNIF